MSIAEPPRKRRPGLRSALAALVVIVVTACATATAGLLEVQRFVDDLNTGQKLDLAPGVISTADVGRPQTILLLGSDHRFKAGRNDARSDTIMLVRLDADSDGTRVMNIPRDLKVEIPGRRGRLSTEKINAAYAYGGPALTTKVVKNLLGIPINHVVNVNFSGFHQAVDYIGCVWTDIDRRYFNDNSTAAYGAGYATINIPAGYQKLCGSQALDYVRFRHMDTDIVRNARQQDFLRQARQQYGVQQAVQNRHELTKIFSKYAQSDSQLHSVDALLKLLTLVAFSSQKPVVSVPFPAILPNGPSDPYVRVAEGPLRKAVAEFMSQGEPKHASGRRKAGGRPRPSAPARVRPAFDSSRRQADYLKGIGMPILVPKVLPIGSRYMGPEREKYPRAYQLRADGGKLQVAYRIVGTTEGTGEYFGIQGTTWRNPPILSQPTATRKLRDGRTLLMFGDGRRLRFVGFKTAEGAYWVSNTLTEDLDNKTMIAMAQSMVPVGR